MGGEGVDAELRLTPRLIAVAAAGFDACMCCAVILRYWCFLSQVASVTHDHARFVAARRGLVTEEPLTLREQILGRQKKRCPRFRHLLRWEWDVSSLLCCRLQSHPYDIPQRLFSLGLCASCFLGSSWYWYGQAATPADEISFEGEVRLVFWTVVLGTPPCWAMGMALAWLRRPVLEAVELGYPALRAMRAGMPCMHGRVRPEAVISRWMRGGGTVSCRPQPPAFAACTSVTVVEHAKTSGGVAFRCRVGRGVSVGLQGGGKPATKPADLLALEETIDPAAIPKLLGDEAGRLERHE